MFLLGQLSAEKWRRREAGAGAAGAEAGAGAVAEAAAAARWMHRRRRSANHQNGQKHCGDRDSFLDMEQSTSF
jgi:hypothetical protein